MFRKNSQGKYLFTTVLYADILVNKVFIFSLQLEKKQTKKRGSRDVLKDKIM